METITNYVPTSVGPSRLEQILTNAPEMTDENKEKLCIIEDIAKIGRLLGNPSLSPENFYTLYDMSVSFLEAVQHNAQIDLNTHLYHQSTSSLL